MGIRIPKDESETVEFKPSLSDSDRIVEVLVSLANLKGGTVYVGVRRDKNGRLKTFGVDIGRDTIERLVGKITDNTEPVIYPHVKVESASGKKVLIIQVGAGSAKPYTGFGRAFKRVGKVTKKMNRDEFERLLRESRHIYYGALQCEGAGIKNIDESKVSGYLKNYKQSRGIPVDPGLPVHENLRKLRVIDETTGIPSNAAIMLFGTDPQSFLPHAQIRCARFKGKGKGDFIDMQDLFGTLPEMIESAMQFVSRNTRVAAKVVETQRAEITEYPMPAIREAIVNAVCHRDYSIGGDDIRVAIFNDRIEVQSPGGLPGHLTLKNIEKEHYLRNPYIAQLLFNIKYVERWNTGIRKMRDMMKGHGLEEPVFEDSKVSFKVIFRGPGENILDLIPKEKGRDISHLNQRQLKALELMVNEERVFSNQSYRNMFNVSANTALRDLVQLVDEGLISTSGKGRAQRYGVIL